MFKTIKNAIKTPDIRKKLLYTLLLIIVFRFGCFITVPGVDAAKLSDLIKQSSGASFSGLINIISGGAFSKLSIFAMSISPYITASIVVQLLAMVIPSLERLTKDGGEEGRRKINTYTRIVTIILALIEALGVYLSYRTSGIFVNESFTTMLLVVSGLVAGTAFLMWLGEQITNLGVGNGISMIIFVGIVSGIPDSIVSLWKLVFTSGGFSTKGLVITLGVIIGAVLLIAGVVFVQQAERRVPVQYAKKVVGRKMYGGQNTHIPLKLAMAGVMPVIFASSFMTFPAMLIQMFNPSIANQTSGFWAGVYKFSIATSSSGVGSGYTIVSAIVYLLLILGFTFFYTYATFNPAEVSNNIKKNGGFIPGIRAGKPTTDYLKAIISKLTWFGGFFLALIAVIPILIGITGLDISFGGTTILIVVGVALETVQQLESQLVMRHYKGFLE